MKFPEVFFARNQGKCAKINIPVGISIPINSEEVNRYESNVD